MNAVTPDGSGFSVPAYRWDLLSDMPARLVRVAVIVPYYNQQDQLDLVITALDAQDYPLELLQIVVADDGSTCAPSIVDARIPITVVRQEDRGFRAAAARNLGVAHADADVLCFLDADTVPQRDYVRRITALPSLCPEALVVGRRRHADFSHWTPQRLRDWWAGGEPPTEFDEPRWLTDEYARSHNLLDLDDRSYRYIISSVMCCTTTLFDDVGGFDETFQQYGGEDWDFAHRAITSGAVLQHARDAVAWHHGPDWAGRELDDRAEIKRAETQAVARVVPDPNLRVPGRVYDIPAVAVQIDADGHDVRSLPASTGSLLDLDVGIWVHGADAEHLLTALQLDDPRIHRGPIPPEVLGRCRHVIAIAGRALLTCAGVDDLLSRCGHGSVGAVTVRLDRAQVTCAASWARNRALRRDPAPRRMISAEELAQLTQAIDVTAETVRSTHAAPHHPGRYYDDGKTVEPPAVFATRTGGLRMTAQARDADSATATHPPTELAAMLGDLAVQMQAQTDPAALLSVILDATVQLMPGIRWAGVAHVRGNKVLAELPTDDVARRLNELQNDVGEGPALSALAERGTITAADLSSESRWPEFVEAATSLGVQCLMVVRLFVEREVLGVLTIYGPTANMFTDESIAVGEILAQHAAVALAGAAAHEQLQAAVASRDLIGQAKGILMARDGISGLTAFAMLAKASQEINLKLTRVAQFIVEEFEQGLSARPTAAPARGDQ